MTFVAIDLTGKIFGRLTVIEQAGRDQRGNVMWLCTCTCGNQKVAHGPRLRAGHVASCGCLMPEVVSRVARTFAHDLTGRVFGRLTVVSRHIKEKSDGASWNCMCSCGQTKVARSKDLKAGELISCGCARTSRVALRSEKARMKSSVRANKRRARKANSTGSFSRAEIRKLFDLQRGKCAWCRADIKKSFHRDHRVPLSAGGTNDISNIDLLCPTCNVRKHAKDPIDWAQQEGFLI